VPPVAVVSIAAEPLPAAGVDSSPGRLSRCLPYLVALVLLAVYAAWSINRHERLLTSGFDLGIFEQAIRGYAHLSAPTAALKAPGFNLLGDHFHPILILVAPFYRIFPSPVTLLVTQALLIAASVIPITRIAIGSAGVLGGAGIGLAYGLSWGLQSAVSFDFHEVCFAVPLISFSLVAIVEERWRSAVLWAVPLVLVKEDLPLTLAAIGLVIMLRGRRRLGAATIGFAVASALVIVTVVIPAFNPDHVYPYTLNQLPSRQGPLRRMFAPAIKWHTLEWILLPVGFLAPLSSISIVAIPTLVWRFWSTNPLYWGMGFQYSAILMPIAFVAFLDATSRLGFFRRDIRRTWVASGYVLTVAVIGTFAFPWNFHGLIDGRNWHVSRPAQEAKAILGEIPEGATVAADNHLAPQLTGRCTVYLFPSFPAQGIDPDWIVYSLPLDTSMAAEVSIDAELAGLDGRYLVTSRNSAAVLLRRRV
jgi:uncharacterized membrane protein